MNKVKMILLAIGLLCSVPARAIDNIDLKMITGEQYQMRAPEAIVRTAIGNPEVLSVKVINSREILLTAKADGRTSLMVWKKGYRNPLRYQVDVTPDISKVAPNTRVQAVEGGIMVSGAVASLAEHDSAMSAAGKGAADSTHSTGPIQVQTDIRIVEVSRNELKNLSSGLSISEFFRGNQKTMVNFSTVGDLFDSANPTVSILRSHSSGRSYNSFINALQTNGYAYTLAEPSLVALSGQTASFLAGGEFPYPTSNSNGDIEIEYREFGVRLKITPTILDNQNIMLKVAPEVSDLDFFNGVQSAGVSVPSLRVRRTDTSIQLASGESFIISGLISSNTASNADKVPGLGDIPIIGAFFRSTRFEREDKELIMIVTPHLVRPLAAQARLPELPGEIYRRHQPSFGDMLFGDAHPEYTGKTWSSPGVGFSD